jgi:hypothetical protein
MSLSPCVGQATGTIIACCTNARTHARCPPHVFRPMPCPRWAVAGRALCRSEDCSLFARPARECGSSATIPAADEPPACDCLGLRHDPPIILAVPCHRHHRSHARLPTRPSSKVVMIDPSQFLVNPGQSNPSPGPICAVGAACRGTQQQQQSSTGPQSKPLPVLCCAAGAVLLTLLYIHMSCPHTVIMRSSLDTASKRVRAICHRNLV